MKTLALLDCLWISTQFCCLVWLIKGQKLMKILWRLLFSMLRRALSLRIEKLKLPITWSLLSWLQLLFRWRWKSLCGWSVFCSRFTFYLDSSVCWMICSALEEFLKWVAFRLAERYHSSLCCWSCKQFCSWSKILNKVVLAVQLEKF